MFRFARALPALILFSTLAAMPAEAVQRVFVASYGSDSNVNCTFANPCRGFTAAMSAVDPGGEVVALDAAGYGVVSIGKSVTITANPGFYAGISAGSGNAVTIAAGGISVILRGLNINGTGGLNGISMANAASLTIENCVISNFSSGRGIFVNAPGTVRVSDSIIRGNNDGIFVQGGATVDVSRSSLKGNFNTGIWVDGSVLSTLTSGIVSDTIATGNGVGFVSVAFGPGTSRLAVTRSTASNNASGALTDQGSGGTAALTISASLVTVNGVGLNNTNGTLESQGNNTVRQNTTDVSGTITTFGGI